MAKRKPKKPLTALWLLEHADSPDQYIRAVDEAPSCTDVYLAMGSLKTAKAQAKHLKEAYGVLCAPVKFDVVQSCGDSA